LKQIVCLGTAPWRNRPTRTQRFLSQFTDAEILYFEPGTPRGPRKDCQRVAPLTYVYTLPDLPVADAEQAHLGRISRWRALRYLLGCLNYHRFDHPLLWVCSPIYNDLIQDIPHGALVYDCFQDWSQYAILWESQLTTRADIVFAASEGLRDHLSPCSKNIVVVPNGLEFSRFDPAATASLPCPADLQPSAPPIFGYTGTVWENLNLAPVLIAAQKHPDWSFVFLGKTHPGNSYLRALRRLPNVRFLGPKKANEIPAYVCHFSAGMAFLRDGMEDDDVLSPRIYEYMAAGIPVVAMYHHMHTEEYPTLIDSAYSPQRFVEMCQKVLTQDTPARRLERQAAAKGCDWAIRCQQVKDVVEECKLLGE
jgi:glycosyltransferase involved in cell wall biosynthesis